MMREALVEARVGVAQIRTALAASQRQLDAERAELERVRRRRQLADGIGDAETVRVAAEFEQRHGERVGVLEQKCASQSAELALAEREIARMGEQMREMLGGGAGPVSPSDASTGRSSPEEDAIRRELERTARDADADRALAELKRRMGR